MILILLVLLVGGCAGLETYPPAVPAPPLAPTELLVPLAPTVVHPEVIQLPSLTTVTYAPPVVVGPKVARKPVDTPAVIAEAAKASLMRPSAEGYREGSAIQVYPYAPGRVYELVSSPAQPSLIQLPRGEALAAPPPLNTEEWEISVAEATAGRRQESLLIRPMKPGLSARTILLCQSGNTYIIALRSTPGVSMVGIGWTLPQEYAPPLPVVASPQKPEKPIVQSPLVGTARRFDGYTITVVKGTTPAWMPAGVWDDGAVTVITFADSLQHTQAPIVLARGPDGKGNIVGMVAHDTGVMGEPAFYVVTGLHPALTLKDSTGTEVRIVREAVQISRAP